MDSEAIIDFANALEAACVNLRMKINAEQRNPQMASTPLQQNAGLQDTKNAPRQWTWNPLQISWIPTEGTNGPYERTDDINNLDYKALHKDLTEHKGALNRDNCFYWLFKNGATIGRKVTKK